MTFEDLVTKREIEVIKKELCEIKSLISHPAPEWLRTEDAMEFLNCKRDYLVRLRSEGRIRCAKIGKIIYYNVRSFYEHLDSISSPLRAA